MAPKQDRNNNSDAVRAREKAESRVFRRELGKRDADSKVYDSLNRKAQVEFRKQWAQTMSFDFVQAFKSRTRQEVEESAVVRNEKTFIELVKLMGKKKASVYKNKCIEQTTRRYDADLGIYFYKMSTVTDSKRATDVKEVKARRSANVK